MSTNIPTADHILECVAFDVIERTERDDVVDAAPLPPAAFRQRLARARATTRRIIDNRCGLVDVSNPCSCSRQIQSSLDAGIMDRSARPWRDHLRATSADDIGRERFERAADQIEQAVAIGELYRRDRFAAPHDLWASVKSATPDLID